MNWTKQEGRKRLTLFAEVEGRKVKLQFHSNMIYVRDPKRLMSWVNYVVTNGEVAVANAGKDVSVEDLRLYRKVAETFARDLRRQAVREQNRLRAFDFIKTKRKLVEERTRLNEDAEFRINRTLAKWKDVEPLDLPAEG